MALLESSSLKYDHHFMYTSHMVCQRLHAKDSSNYDKLIV
jgi:hypothetical protein